MHVVIIGNGIAGVTTARHIRKRSDYRITIISAESDHFYSRPALMYIYLGHLTFEQTKPYEDHFWEKNKLELVRGFVTGVDPKTKSIQLRDGRQFYYDKLVLAVGAKPNFFGWPGQDSAGVQGFYSLQDLAQLEQSSRHCRQAVIVGGGLIGVELAEMLLSRGIQVQMLVRESHYWGNILRREEGLLVGRHLENHGVTLRLNTQLHEIFADEQGQARAVRTDNGEEIPCRLVGITAGVSPNIDFLKDSPVPTNRGILVNSFLESDVPNIYAVGDCAEISRPDQARTTIEPLWYTGRMQGEALAATICGQPTTYDRGIWFNSAKFFDIEYHTYGMVAPEEQKGEASFYWEDEAGTRCIRLVYREKDRILVGMNALGLRYRHRVFARWLAQSFAVEQVINHLEEAQFDPEFFRCYANEMRRHFLASI